MKPSKSAKEIRSMVKDAEASGANLYMQSSANSEHWFRVVGATEQRGLTMAKILTGSGLVPVGPNTVFDIR